MQVIVKSHFELEKDKKEIFFSKKFSNKTSKTNPKGSKCKPSFRLLQTKNKEKKTIQIHIN